MISELFTGLEKLITEHGSATILKERIVQLREEFDRLKDKHDSLERDNERLKAEVERLGKALEKEAIPNEYIEHRGVLFRRLPNGNIQDEVYCPSCKCTMGSLEGELPYRCSKCRFAASFTGHDLKRIVAEVASL